MIKPEEIEAVRHFITHCTLNDTPKVLGLCQQLLSEIELQQQVIDQHTTQFFKGEMNATNETNGIAHGVRGDTAAPNTGKPEPVRTVPEVQPFTETRRAVSDSGDVPEAEDDLPEYRDYRIKERRSQGKVDDSRLEYEVGGQVRREEGDDSSGGQSIDRAMTRNQRRRNKRKQKRGQQ